MKNLADVDQSTEFEINDLVLLQNFVKGKEIEFPDNLPEPPKSSFNYNANGYRRLLHAAVRQQLGRHE